MPPSPSLSRRWVLRGTVSTLLWSSLCPGPAVAASTQPLLVFAAASLTNALTQVDALWQAQGHPASRFSFASSGTLAQQIDHGAPADLFVSADEKWMDWLAARGRLVAGSRQDLLGNRLVLVERKADLKPVILGPHTDFAAVLGAQGRLAVGEPASVPAGIYAKQALTKLGLWNAIQGRLAPAENVRAALLLVERGEAPAGIVYATDVPVAPGLAVAGIFPESSHTPIVYPGAVLKAAGQPKRAAALLSDLGGGAAQAIFHNLGFSKPPGA
ncbi:molybdate ABC transporter substrate-binding protein [Lichenicoccus sp.]|uniref:molybdate ABC transporter substrate-binding protein n=1 Tax=Lichenicoccus sp. TaxID=2781899 RepID=UPI003D12C4A4